MTGQKIGIGEVFDKVLDSLVYRVYLAFDARETQLKLSKVAEKIFAEQGESGEYSKLISVSLENETQFFSARSRFLDIFSTATFCFYSADCTNAITVFEEAMDAVFFDTEGRMNVQNARLIIAEALKEIIC